MSQAAGAHSGSRFDLADVGPLLRCPVGLDLRIGSTAAPFLRAGCVGHALLLLALLLLRAVHGIKLRRFT